jgi:YXWGXW repeat-containing protein
MRALRFIIPVVAVFLLAIPAPSSAQVTIGFTIGQPPPPLPVYDSIPQAPYPNYMWTPGYWSYGPAGYYWVPGTWVQPPQTGLYWTPGYWGYNNGGYGWNNGYWAPQVGFYGGVNYGFGYPGTGFYGGTWQPSGFSYNTAVWPVNRTVIHNTYVNRTVINKTVINRTSYNGGKGGIQMHPDARQLQVMHERHYEPTSAQRDHARVASRDRNLYASVNKGHPNDVNTDKPFNDKNHPKNAAPLTDQDKAAAKHNNNAPQHKNSMQPQHNQKPPAQHNNGKPPSQQQEHGQKPPPQHKDNNPPSNQHDQNQDKKPPLH